VLSRRRSKAGPPLSLATTPTQAYQFTSLTSVTLLDCFTIPAVIALSFFVLGARYRRQHYAAAALCVLGLALLVATDERSSTAGAAPLLGDALVVAGALLYSVSNVTQELFLGGSGTAEVLGMVGAFGAVIAAAQAALLERDAWAALISRGDGSDGGPAATAGAALAAFTAALYAFSSLVPVVLIWGGATALNLSLLTSDLWAAAARVLLFGGFGGGAGWFIASLALVAAGLCLYASAGSPKSTAAAEMSSGGGDGGIGGLAFAACPTSEEGCSSFTYPQQQQQQRSASQGWLSHGMQQLLSSGSGSSSSMYGGCMQGACGSQHAAAAAAASPPLERLHEWEGAAADRRAAECRLLLLGSDLRDQQLRAAGASCSSERGGVSQA